MYRVTKGWTFVSGMLFMLFLVLTVTPCNASFLDDIFRESPQGSKTQTSDSTVISGLKEALSIGTGNAVTSLSAFDGYFANQAVKILLPDEMNQIASILKTLGFSKLTDEFVVSMNRAAEKAAPIAKGIFIDAITQMTFEDAKNILNGGNTSATDYFKKKTYTKLFDTFKPDIGKSLDSVGATKSYRDVTSKYISLVPFAQAETFDLDQYVTRKALDGLFLMIGQEEKNIRTNPAARVTDLLKSVFGSR